MTAELRAWREDPFELLLRLDGQVRSARLDVAAGQAEDWTGLGFRLGSDWLLVPRDEVREVVPPPARTRIPNARAWVLGVANVRGGLLTLVDLQQVLGGPPATAGRAQRVLVLNAERLPVGFVVDEVAGYRQFLPQDQVRLSAADNEALQPLELGGFRRDDRLWRVISLHKLVRTDTFRQAGW
ncbi:chemotaxis protein CheW [Flagellatimonas centrodinii]|uniref:chemotaxis protein CheW n=1 Tax=Flagellatimonas centrodinii TaxID=2806210 RepID=UPI001FEF95D4|nr:chemotaxis protein CheW [Flagellatimonas centrodinii]ULQ45527.1 chemotaxis protein CheW [Flagellatimonas centrodinii]